MKNLTGFNDERHHVQLKRELTKASAVERRYQARVDAAQRRLDDAVVAGNTSAIARAAKRVDALEAEFEAALLKTFNV